MSATSDHDIHDDARFDAAMRQRHARALEDLSPRIVSQLHQRRRAALEGAPASRRTSRPFAWMAFASGAAVLALVVGLQLRPANIVSEPTVGSATAAINAATEDDLDIVLDENPDFYLWLASSDAYAVAME